MNRTLCVGINNYPGTNSDLSGCVNDANDVDEFLRVRGFETWANLQDYAATKQTIEKEMAGIIAATRYGETAVIHFSGHGTHIPDENADEWDGRDEAWCPYDVFDAQLVTDDEIAEIVSRKRYGARVVILSDSCHSGSVNRLFGDGVSLSKRKIKFLPPSTFMDPAALRYAQNAQVPRRSRSKAKLRETASILISGCDDPEYSYDAWFDGRANGAFTYWAIRALNKAMGMGNLVTDEVAPSYQDWYDEIRRCLPSADYPQTPQLSGRSYMLNWKAL